MIIQRTGRFSTLLSLISLTALFALAGCGGDDIECGPNTINDNGTCTPAEGSYSCGSGTQVGPNGTCVLSDGSCGPNLVFNSEAQRCVPDREECRSGAEFNPETSLCVAAVGCGEGTTEEAGTCVPDPETVCGGGAVRYEAESDSCVVTSGACGEGTQLSAQGTCVSDITACGESLALNEAGQCVPTDEVCTEGTTFDPNSNLCLPSTRCQQGDVVLNAAEGPGICVSPARQLADNADVTEQESPGASHNDPTLGGTAVDMGSISQGSDIAFTGTISAPSDRNNDGQIDQDRDGFSFTASAGTWVELSVQSLGLPAPWFTVRGPNGYVRNAPVGRDAARQLILPYEGTYTVLVAPEAASSSVQTEGGPFGASNWDYVGELSGISPAVNNPIALSASGSKTGDLPTLTDNIYQLDGFSGGSVVELSAPSIGADAEGVVGIWSDATTLTRTARIDSGESVLLTIPSSGPAPIVSVDWTSIYGTDDAYEISASAQQNAVDLGSVSSGDDTISSGRSLAADTPFRYAVELPADSILEVQHMNDQDSESIDLALETPLGRQLGVQTNLPEDSGLDSSGDDIEGYFWIESGGHYVLSAESDDALTGHQVEVASHSPVQVGNATPGASINANVSSGNTPGVYRSKWFIFTAQQAVTADISSSATPSSGDVDIDTELYDVKRTPYNLRSDMAQLGFELGTNSLSLEPTGLTAGRYLVRVGIGSSVDSMGVSGDFSAPPALEQEPNDTTANATPLAPGTTRLGEVRGAGEVTRDPTQSTPDADTDRYTFNISQSYDADSTSEITVVSPTTTEDGWSCSITGPNGNIVDEVTARDAGCVLQVPGIATGDYTVEVSVTNSTWRRYEISHDLRSAIYTQPESAGSTTRSMGLTDTEREEFAVGRLSAANPVDRFEATVPTSNTGALKMLTRFDFTGPDPASNVQLQVLDGSGNELALLDEGELFAQPTSGGDEYELVLADARGSTITDADGEYELRTFAYEPDASASASPGAEIPESPVSSALSTVDITQSCTVTRVIVDVDITSTFGNFVGQLTLQIEGPNGTTVDLNTPFNRFQSSLVGSFPFKFEPVGSLDSFNSSNGQGTWSLYAGDGWNGVPPGFLNSWTLSLTCQ